MGVDHGWKADLKLLLPTRIKLPPAPKERRTPWWRWWQGGPYEWSLMDWKVAISAMVVAGSLGWLIGKALWSLR